jgi:hypothetical protein
VTRQCLFNPSRPFFYIPHHSLLYISLCVPATVVYWLYHVTVSAAVRLGFLYY